MDRRQREWMQDVLERFEVPLVRYAERITGDLERARDVVQDALLRLWRRADEVDPDRLAQWLYTVCRNRALDVLRKERRRSSLSPEQAARTPDQADDPARAAERRDLARVARELLDNLPDRQQEVIRLRLEGRLSYNEIADATGLSSSNVGFLLHVGLKRLREQMRAKGLMPQDGGQTPP